jgi:hypothetical protein
MLLKCSHLAFFVGISALLVSGVNGQPPELADRFRLQQRLVDVKHSCTRFDLMRASANQLAFICFSGPTITQGQLIITDLAGNAVASIGLGEDEILDLALGGTGSIAVVSASSEGSTKIIFFDRTGNHLGPPRLTQPIFRLSYSGSTLYGVTRDGVLYSIQKDDETPIGRFSTRLSATNHLLPDPDGTVLVVDGVGASIARFNPKEAAQPVAFQINSQEVKRVLQMYSAEQAAPPDSQPPVKQIGVAIIASAGDEQRKTYHLLSGFRSEEGAPVVVSDKNGTQSGLIRIPMVYEGRKTVGPVCIAVSSNRLFVLDSAWTVSVYHLQ